LGGGFARCESTLFIDLFGGCRSRSKHHFPHNGGGLMVVYEKRELKSF